MAPIAGTELRGRVLERQELHGFTLTETQYEPGTSLGSHCHEGAGFVVVLDGGFAERYGPSADFECDRWSLLFRPAGEVHADRFGPTGSRCLTIELRSEWMQRFDHRAVPPGFPLQLRPDRSSAAWLSTRLYAEFRTADAVSALALEGLVLEALATVWRTGCPPAAGRPRWLDAARQMLHEPASRPTVAELADVAGVHPAHLSAVFRRHFGCTIGQYARARRFAVALEALEDWSLPLAEVAALSGFADQSHLTRTCRQRTGLTPQQLRTRLRRKTRKA